MRFLNLKSEICNPRLKRGFTPTPFSLWHRAHTRRRDIGSCTGHYRGTSQKARGFTLIEILVVLGIFAIITAIMLFNFTGFASRTGVDTGAQDVALAIRQAQVYGISSRELSPDSEVFPTFGVYFDGSSLPISSFILFADTDKDGVYGAGDEEIEKIVLQDELVISELTARVFPGGGTHVTLNNLHLTFTRPNPEATIIGDSAEYAVARIKLHAVRDPSITRTVTMWTNGQIATE